MSGQLAPKTVATSLSTIAHFGKEPPVFPSKCEEEDISWSLTFKELLAPKEAVFVCVCLSLLKFTLFERGENRPPGPLSNSFGPPYTASRGRRVYSAWLCRPTADASWAFCLKPDGSACWPRYLPGVTAGWRCKGAAVNVLWRAGSGHCANPPSHCWSWQLPGTRSTSVARRSGCWFNFMDVTADVLQGSGSCLQLELKESPFNLFGREVH